MIIRTRVKEKLKAKEGETFYFFQQAGLLFLQLCRAPSLILRETLSKGFGLEEPKTDLDIVCFFFISLLILPSFLSSFFPLASCLLVKKQGPRELPLISHLLVVFFVKMEPSVTDGGTASGNTPEQQLNTLNRQRSLHFWMNTVGLEMSMTLHGGLVPSLFVSFPFFSYK